MHPVRTLDRDRFEEARHVSDAGGRAGPALVTGATGFIGRRLVARLLAEGCAVRALVLPEEAVEGVWPGTGTVEVFRGDVADAGAVERAVRGAGTVFHLAAVVSDWGPEELFRRVTVGGTANVLGAAAAAGARAVLASSVVVYGDAIGRDVCDEEHPFGRPMGPYSRSKQAQETLGRELAAERGLALTIVRPTNVYGPGSKPWVHDLVAQLRSGRPALIGGQPRNAGLCHVENVVQVLVRAAASPRAVGRAYNACDGSDVTWERYVTDVARLAGTDPPRTVSPLAARIGARVGEAVFRLLRRKRRPPITREALNLVGSNHRVPIDRARAELGYEPRVPYEDGIEQVAAYLRGLRRAP